MVVVLEHVSLLLGRLLPISECLIQIPGTLLIDFPAYWQQVMAEVLKSRLCYM